jgi:chaperone required for assembly of F1-ATPase
MRDIIEDIFTKQPLDPTEAARRAVRPNLRKRFYAQAIVGPEQDRRFPVLLDGRPVRTPARRPLAAPNPALAQAIADEWQAQESVIDPARMPLTRLANTIIDGLAAAQDKVAEEIARYLGSDLLLYRAGEPQTLVARQAELWDPVLDWMRERGARFVLAEGVMHVAQPQEAISAASALIPPDIWRLGAVHTVTTLTGSALLALALAHGRLSADEVWAAAHVDDDFNLQQWGADELALQRRAFREAEMQAAAEVLRHTDIDPAESA